MRRSMALVLIGVGVGVFFLVQSGRNSITPRPLVVQRVADVDLSRLIGHVTELCGIGPRPESDRAATAATLDYLERAMSAAGYAPVREPFDALMQDWRKTEDGGWILTSKPGVKHHNLTAELRGSGKSPAVVALGAHYDSKPWSVGADDNASGVAVVLEAARVLRGVQTDKTVRFVFFAMEEEGLVGSAALAKAMRARGEEVEGVIVLDMVGYACDGPDSQASPVRIPLLLSPPTVGDFIVVVGNNSSGWLGNLFEASAGAYVPQLPYYSLNRLGSWFSDAVRSDHASFWAAGYDAILLSDTAEMRNPHYHKATDTPETLDRSFLLSNARAVVATLIEWAAGR